MVRQWMSRETYGSYRSSNSPWGTSRERSENHSCGDYFAWRKWGISEQQEYFPQRYLYFRWNFMADEGIFAIPRCMSLPVCYC
jgi:hypothetical protein